MKRWKLLRRSSFSARWRFRSLREHVRRPAAADCLVQINQRSLPVAQRDALRLLGIQQISLRSEHIEVAGVTTPVTQVSEVVRLDQPRATLFLREKAGTCTAVCNQSIVRITKCRLHRST